MAGSTWNSVQGFLGPGWPHWPNPFPAIKEMNVLACEDTWQAEVTFYVYTIGSWFFSSFVPSPTELTRKFVTGSYKCGFYLDVPLKSPLDVIWKDAKIGKALLGFVGPVNTAIFYFWMAQTFFSTLDAFQTMYFRGELCGATRDETLLSDGDAPIVGGGAGSGAAVFYNVLWDPQHRYGPPGSSIIYLDGPLNVYAYGHVAAGAAGITSVRVYLYTVNGELAQQDLGAIPPLKAVSFRLVFQSGNVDASAVAVGFDIVQPPQPPLDPSHVHVTRFTLTQHDQPQLSPGGGLHIPNQCLAPDQPPMQIPNL